MTQETSLKSILNKNIDDHKEEIKFIAKSSLTGFKSSNQLENITRWKTSKAPSKHKLKSDFHPRKHKSRSDNNDDFSNRMFLFSLGPDEVVDKSFNDKSIKKPLHLKSLDEKCNLKNLKSDSNLNNNNKVDSFIEENVDINCSADKFNFLSPRYPIRNKSKSKEFDNSNEEIRELLPHYIHPSYKTQYNELLRFREENIREKDVMEKEILSGTSLVKHLEKRLKSKLQTLDTLGRTPNFHRLQIYGEIFDDLISESWMFGTLLSKIKSAYDAEIDRVLEMPVSQKELLQSEMDQLRQSIYNKEKLENIQSEVLQVEDAIKLAIKTNEEYEILMKDEEKKLEELVEQKCKIDEEKRRKFKSSMITVIPTESEKLELLKTQCWEILDNISIIQKQTKEKMCSRSTITHLTEAVQDIGIEVEKLSYHKNQIESEVDLMRNQLSNLLQITDISEEDYKLINSIINGSSIIPLQDYVESNKWNWYIS